MNYKITLVRFTTDVNFDSTGTTEWGADTNSNLGYDVEDKGSQLVFTPKRAGFVSRIRVPMWNVAQINEKEIVEPKKDNQVTKDDKSTKGGKADAS
jgi:hypothetical protein